MNGLITTTPPNATSPIWGQIAKLCHDYSTKVACLITILETFRDNPEIGPSLVHDSAITELKKAEAGYCKSFEALVNISNSTTATYHTLVESHGNCERLIKELTASGGNSNLVTNSVLIIQTQKALIEQEMLETEECQCQTWQTIEAVHFACKWKARERNEAFCC